MAAADVTITRGDSPSRGRKAAWRPWSALALGVGSPGCALRLPSPWITISSRVPASPRSFGCSQAGEAGGQHIRGQGHPFSWLGMLVLCRALLCLCGSGGLLWLCRVCVPAESREMCLGSRGDQRWPFLAVGLMLYLPYYSRGWVRAHPELCSPSWLWKSL